MKKTVRRNQSTIFTTLHTFHSFYKEICSKNIPYFAFICRLPPEFMHFLRTPSMFAYIPRSEKDIPTHMSVHRLLNVPQNVRKVPRVPVHISLYCTTFEEYTTIQAFPIAVLFAIPCCKADGKLQIQTPLTGHAASIPVSSSPSSKTPDRRRGNTSPTSWAGRHKRHSWKNLARLSNQSMRATSRCSATASRVMENGSGWHTSHWQAG